MATAYFTSPKEKDRLAQLWEDLRAEALPFHPIATQGRKVGTASLLKQEEAVSRSWRADFSTWLQGVLEPEVGTISEREASSEPSLAAAHETALAISSPFHWEPKPAWINIPGRSTPALLNPADPRLFAAKPKIPIRPLHKQPLYRRVYFYLSRWLRSR